MIPSSTASCPPAKGGLTMVGMIISNLLVSSPGSSRVWGGGGEGEMMKDNEKGLTHPVLLNILTSRGSPSSCPLIRVREWQVAIP